MPSTTAAGTGLALSAGVPATQTAAGYTALTYTEVSNVESLGGFGASTEVTTFQPLKGSQQKHKGPTNFGALNPTIALDDADAGQALLASASAPDNRALYAVRVTKPDGSLRYFQVRVFGMPETIGAANSMITAAPVLEINTPVVKVAAGAPPAPVFTTQPTISPTSGAVGTTFTASDGAASNAVSYTRRWLLGTTAIGTGTTVTPNAAGSLTLEVTATGLGGTNIATSAAATVTAASTPTPTPGPVTQIAPTSAQGFTWDFAANPITVVKQTNGKYTTDLDPKSKVNAAMFSGPTYYVVPGATMTGDALTEATAVGSIAVALKKLNDSTGATGGTIRIKSGEYPIATGVNDAGGAQGLAGLRPTKHTAFIGYGTTRPITGPWRPGLTFALTASGGGVYTVVRNNVGRVLDTSTTDGNGDFIEIPARVDEATVRSSTSGWFVDSSGNLLVKRADGAQPVDANTRVFLHTDAMALGSANVDIYSEFIELHGGDTNFNGRGGGTRNLIGVDMVAKYGGTARPATAGTASPSVGGNAFSVSNITGFAGFFRCVAARSAQDGIAFTGTFPWLTVDCIARDNGMPGQVSCNGLTEHVNNLGIDLNGDYPRNAGGNIRMINATQFWGCGTKGSNDRGDVGFGGTLPPCDFNLGDTSKAWLQDIAAAGSQISLSVDANAAAYLRNETLPSQQIKNGTVAPF